MTDTSLEPTIYTCDRCGIPVTLAPPVGDPKSTTYWVRPADGTQSDCAGGPGYGHEVARRRSHRADDLPPVDPTGDVTARTAVTDLLASHTPLQATEGHWVCSECEWEDPDREVSAGGLRRFAEHLTETLLSSPHVVLGPRFERTQERSTVLQAEVSRLKRDGSPGVMHEIDKAFYNLTVKERDYARRSVDHLTSEVKGLKATIDGARADRDTVAAIRTLCDQYEEGERLEAEVEPDDYAARIAHHRERYGADPEVQIPLVRVRDLLPPVTVTP